jgi:prolyl 4-hydroxylase
MGRPQSIIEGYEDDIWEAIISARDYLNHVVWEDEFLSMSYDVCINKDSRCAYWAVNGECDNNPEWMGLNCGPVCGTCEQTSIYTRCPLDPDAKNAWEPGDLNRFFEHITTAEEFQQYEPLVWSRPKLLEGDTEETADYVIGAWLVTMENFVSQEEADHMIELGRIEGYKVSVEFGEEEEDGSIRRVVSQHRTSMNSWCNNECARDPVAVELRKRMSHLAGMPPNHAESFQLLRYEPGQFYKLHHDFSWFETERQQGPRILTIFLYLNDMPVEDGGGTDFPELNVTVTPRRGRIAIWVCCILSDMYTALLRLSFSRPCCRSSLLSCSLASWTKLLRSRTNGQSTRLCLLKRG